MARGVRTVNWAPQWTYRMGLLSVMTWRRIDGARRLLDSSLTSRGNIDFSSIWWGGRGEGHGNSCNGCAAFESPRDVCRPPFAAGEGEEDRRLRL